MFKEIGSDSYNTCSFTEALVASKPIYINIESLLYVHGINYSSNLPLITAVELNHLIIYLHDFLFYKCRGKHRFRLTEAVESLHDNSRCFGIKTTVHIVIDNWPFVYWIPSGNINLSYPCENYWIPAGNINSPRL